MLFEQVLPLLREGKRIAMPNWTPGNYIWIDFTNDKIYRKYDDCSDSVRWDFKEILSDQWIEYEEKYYLIASVKRPEKENKDCFWALMESNMPFYEISDMLKKFPKAKVNLKVIDIYDGALSEINQNINKRGLRTRDKHIDYNDIIYCNGGEKLQATELLIVERVE
ncbi:MAG: hypothetical protein FWC41_00570 [Firmicutes bacterium]|nr:hypothetical protein [Bacillota bacterium]